MAKLTISDAARVAGVSRVTLHRYIKAGKLSRTPDGMIDTAELLRLGMVLRPATVSQPVTVQQEVTPPATPLVSASDTGTVQQLISVLQRELDAAHAREHAAQEREALLLQMLSQMQQQNQRLLDMPRATPVPPMAPVPTTLSFSENGAVARGAMRQRIIALLQRHPEGLTPAQIRTHLGVEKRLAHTCVAMARDGLLRRLGPGVYGV